MGHNVAVQTRQWYNESMGTLQYHNIYNWNNIELGSNVSVSL